MHELKKIFFKKKILIYGLGISGTASFFYLKRKNKVNVFIIKLKNLKKKKFKKNIIKKNQIFKTYFDYIIISPGIDYKKCALKNFLINNKNKICTDLDIFYSNNPQNKIITITGTNGKSTSVKLINDILKNSGRDSRSVGNIGKSILNEKNINKNTIFVIEASSYQIEYSKIFTSNFSILLNISPDHIDRHGSFRKYLNAKLKLFYNSTKRDYIFFNRKNLVINNAIKKNKIKAKIINVDQNINKKYFFNIKNKYFENENNLENLSFVLSICEKLKIKKNIIIKTINSFQGLKYRQQIVYRSPKLIIVNDSKSTSFSSTLNLLNSYNNIFWILGGQPKKNDTFKLKKNNNLNIQAFIFGKYKNFFVNQLRGKVKFQVFPSMKIALHKIIAQINGSNNKLKKTILFSPCSASFDEFKNFEERGAYFNYLIKSLKSKI